MSCSSFPDRGRKSPKETPGLANEIEKAVWFVRRPPSALVLRPGGPEFPVARQERGENPHLALAFRVHAETAQDGDIEEPRLEELLVTGNPLGEHAAGFLELPFPAFSGVDIDRVEDGKIIEHCGAVNTFVALFEHKLISGV